MKIYDPSGATLQDKISLIARFMGPTWGPSGADRTQVGPMLAPWNLLSGVLCGIILLVCVDAFVGVDVKHYIPAYTFTFSQFLYYQLLAVRIQVVKYATYHAGGLALNLSAYRSSKLEFQLFALSGLFFWKNTCKLFTIKCDSSTWPCYCISC